MTKRTIITGFAALCLMSTNAMAQQTDVQKPESDYNTRTAYMRLSHAIGGGDWYTHGLGAGVFAKVHPRINTGISAYYFGDAGGRAKIDQIIPVSAEIQYDLGPTEKGNGSVLIGTAIGYNFVLNKVSEPYPNLGPVEMRDGLYFNPSIGYRLNFTKNTGIIFDLGYQLVRGNEVESGTDVLIKKRAQSNLLFKTSLFF